MLEMVAAFEKASGKVYARPILFRLSLYALLRIIHNLDLVVFIVQKIPVKLCPRRPGDATAVYASTEKAKRELGWT